MSENPMETSEPSIPENAETVENADDGDFDHEFIVQGKRIPVRKSALARQSPVLSAELEQLSSEITLNDTVITDVEFMVFKTFIDYLHTGSCPNIGYFPVKLFIVADRYRVEELCEKCEIEMLNTLSIYNAAHYLAVAIKLKRTNLTNSIADFIESESPGIFELNAWRYVAGNLGIMVDVLKLFSLRQRADSRADLSMPFRQDDDFALIGQISVASNEVQFIPSSTENQASRPTTAIPNFNQTTNPFNKLHWDSKTVTWTFDRASALRGTELTSGDFFVLFPALSSLCGYQFVYQPHQCIQCRTNFKIAVCQINPNPDAKLIGAIAGKDCTIMNGCGRCLSYSHSLLMRKLKLGDAGVDHVGYGRCDRIPNFEFTFTVSELSGCRIDPLCGFIVGEETVFCSSQTLVTKSNYFAQLLRSNSGKSFVLKDEYVTPDDFRVIASYLTSDRPPDPSKVNLVVLRMAKKFKLCHLFSLCDEILAQKITSNPACAVLWFVIGYEMCAARLKESAKSYIKNNIETIGDSDWKHLQDTPELLLELLMELV